MAAGWIFIYLFVYVLKPFLITNAGPDSTFRHARGWSVITFGRRFVYACDDIVSCVNFL